MGDGYTSTQVASGIAGGAAIASGTAFAAGAAGVTVSVTVPTTVALVGGGTAVVGTTFTAGAANFWNPVGWALLIIAAVAALVCIGIWLYENWDAVCEFFSNIFSWLWDKATIVYEWVVNTAVPWIVDTATDIWNSIKSAFTTAATATVTTATAAAVTVEGVRRKYVAGQKRLAAALAAAIASQLPPKDDAVYLIRMLIYDDYIRLNWGKPSGLHNYPNDCNGDNRYKYGTTKNGVEGRYSAGSYVMMNINSVPPKMSDEYVVKNVNFYEARIIEKAYIYGYFMQHFPYYPPGNSKLG